MHPLNAFIEGMPKVEVHCHIEGTLEPELMFALAKRNHRTLPYPSIETLKNAYQFNRLQAFLDIYYQGARVLIKQEDFYDMTMAYLKKAHAQQVRHVELFFDPQTHTSRGIPFKTVIQGIHEALMDAEAAYGMSSRLILCFLRHLCADSAMDTLIEALPFKEYLCAVGLDSSEKNNPPNKFTAVFDRARKEGFLTVAHAGEEGPADYIWQAIDLLKVSRIDHGVRCTEDPKLIRYLKETQIPLTVCPLSNIKLHVFDKIEQHNIKQLMDAGLCVTVNSDDPAYFGGYMNENYLAITQGLNLSKDDLYQLAAQGIRATFLPEDKKRVLMDELDAYFKG